MPALRFIELPLSSSAPYSRSGNNVMASCLPDCCVDFIPKPMYAFVALSSTEVAMLDSQLAYETSSGFRECKMPNPLQYSIF